MIRTRIAMTLLATGVVAVATSASGQSTVRLPRIGWLATALTPAYVEAFRDGLRERGWIDGQSCVIDWRFADGKPERLPEVAADLVRAGVDVIVASTNRAAFAAKGATSAIPIVAVATHDAVGTGLVASLARPGGNVTALESLAPELDAKRLQLVSELVPRATRIGVLYNSLDVAGPLHVRYAEAGARALNQTLRLLDVRDAQALESALAVIERERPDALLVFTDVVTFLRRAAIVEFAARTRLPAIYEFRDFVEAGGLAAYGPSLRDMVRRAASQVDRILRGARPADLPVEQPTRFELVLNLRTARALGLALSPSILARADEIIP